MRFRRTSASTRGSRRSAAISPRRAAAPLLAGTLVLVAAACSSSTAGGSASSGAIGASSGATSSGQQASTLDTVSIPPPVTAAPVGIDDVAPFGNAVSARIVSVASTQAEAHVPGERSGPGVLVTVEMTNGSAAPINLDNVTVDLTDANGSSASRVTPTEPHDLAGDLAPGQTTTGEYLFAMPVDQRGSVTVRVKYSADTPVVIFAGSIADA